MTLPTNSVNIQGIGTTSPAVESGKTSVVRLSDELKEFMSALSPAGATAYDTGWVTLTPTASWTVTNAVQIRRVGMEVRVRGILQAAVANPTTIIADAGIPAGMRTVGQNLVLPLATSTNAAGRATVGNAGSIGYTGVLAAGQYLYLNNLHYFTD